MTEFRTTATHDGRAVPMPEVDSSVCSSDAYDRLSIAYYNRRSTTVYEDDGDFRDRILADARASAAPSEDAIRAFEAGAEWAALRYLPTGQPNFYADTLAEAHRRYAPRPVYAAPVALSAPGATFGQVGPDLFRYSSPIGNRDEPAAIWHVESFNPRDGKLVLAVLDGAERAK